MTLPEIPKLVKIGDLGAGNFGEVSLFEGEGIQYAGKILKGG